MRRHTGSVFGAGDAGPWRRLGRDLGLVALTFAVGYAVSSYYITPGSVLTNDHAIPRVLGQPVDQARSVLASAGFRSRVDGERPSAAIPRGGVIWQDPPPDTAVPPNSTVALVVSAGPAPAAVPDVIGFALPYAEKVVEAAGIKVGRVDTVRGAAAEDGVVVATRPAPGTGRARGASVDLVVIGAPEGAPEGAP